MKNAFNTDIEDSKPSNFFFRLMNSARALAIFWPSWVLIVLLYVALIFLPQGQDILRSATESSWQLIWSGFALIFASITVWYSSRLYGFTQLKVLKNAPFISKHFLRFLSFFTYTLVIIGILKLAGQQEIGIRLQLFPANWLPQNWITPLSTILMILLSAAWYFSIVLISKKLQSFCNNYKRCLRMLLVFFALAVIGVFVPVIHFNHAFVILGLAITQSALAVMLQMRGHWSELLMYRKASKKDNTSKRTVLRFPKAQNFFSKLLLKIRRSIINTNRGESAEDITDALNSFDTNLVYNSIYSCVALLSAFAMVAANNSIWIASSAGALTWILIGLSGIAGTINVIRAFGRSMGIRFLGLALVLALIAGLAGDPHKLRTVNDDELVEKVIRLNYVEQLEHWNNTSDVPTINGKKPLVFVMADGGALRSGYWTSLLYSKLDSMCGSPFGNKVFCFSGASGGSTGNAIYYSALMSGIDEPGKTSKAILHQDLFSHTAARMLGNDVLNVFLPLFADRGAGLEDALKTSAFEANNHLILDKPFEHFIPNDNKSWSPILTMNTTRIQDAAPALISTMDIKNSSGLNHRADVLAEKYPSDQHQFASMALLGSRFPYVSPAGAIRREDDEDKMDYYVDGGYMDNSGAGIVLEMIIQLDSLKTKTDSATKAKFMNIQPFIIHITNTSKSGPRKGSIHPLVNNLAAPIQAIVGSYGEQTDILTTRLLKYLGSNYDESCYLEMNLFENDSTQIPYNWLMSDSTKRKMETRLSQQEENLQLIHARLK